MWAQIHAGSSLLPSTLPWGTVAGHHVVRGANDAGAGVRGTTMRSGSGEGERGKPGQTRAPSGMVVWLRSASTARRKSPSPLAASTSAATTSVQFG